MENPSSPLETLRQLKEMLDAGALTPTEFEALKQRLVFSPAPTLAEAPPPAAAGSPAAVLPPEAMVPPAAPVAEETVAPLPASIPNEPVRTNPASTEPRRTESALPEPASIEPGPPHSGWTVPGHVVTPDSRFLPDATPDFPAPDLPVAHPGQETHPFRPETEELPAPPAARGSSLGLVLAIAGVLVFLAVVAYLGFNRPTTDEHLTSTSQTAADSVHTTIETGPQVAPLPAASAAPETVRVAPTNPAPALPSRAEMEAKAAAGRDSAAAGQIPAKSDSTGNQ